MKALTLKEPWLALIAAGKKKIETRSWEDVYKRQAPITVTSFSRPA